MMRRIRTSFRARTDEGVTVPLPPQSGRVFLPAGPAAFGRDVLPFAKAG